MDIIHQIPLIWRRTPHGVRGLKFRVPATFQVVGSRTPHGVRGLKSKTYMR